MGARAISAAVALSLVPLWSDAAQCLHYGAPDVSIAGALSLLPGEGGGAGDRWYIEATEAFCIGGSADLGDEPFGAERRFEVVPSHALHLKRFVSGPVAVRGQFLHSNIPHYHRYLIFSVTSIRRVGHGNP